ncbi:MAG: ISL3 family transposase [Pseudomonadota bacterium]
MSEKILSHLVFLPELKVRDLKYERGVHYFYLDKDNTYEVCPKCATPSHSTYDHRVVRVRDSQLRGKHCFLVVRKRRFWCKKCGKPFTEPLAGVRKHYRTTARYRQEVFRACLNYTNLKQVRKDYQCSNGFIYKVLYERLELERRKRLYPWPKTIGIDEHCFGRSEYGRTRFSTTLVDYNNKSVMEVIDGKSMSDLRNGLGYIPGRENVKNAVMDMSPTFKNFSRLYFPNAKIIADKFHVIRLLHPAINKKRISITGDVRKNPIRKLLLKNGYDLSYIQRYAITRWLEQNPDVREIYQYKEAVHRFYRTKGKNKAEQALTNLIARMKTSTLNEVKTTAMTLNLWKNEILNYFENRITNARTEGFNNKAKLVKRMAYGYKNFNNYRLRLLNACS